MVCYFGSLMPVKAIPYSLPVFYLYGMLLVTAQQIYNIPFFKEPVCNTLFSAAKSMI